MDAPAPPSRSPDHRSRLPLLAAAGLLVLVVVVVATAMATPGPLPGVAREPAPRVDGLTFVDHRDPSAPRETGLTPAPGELVLLYFGYLSCPDVCPMTMADIARARRTIGPDLASRTRVAFVTLDPERDDADRLRSYLGHFFDEDYLALTAPHQDTLDVAVERLGLRYEVEAHAPGAERYDVSHSAITYVIDDTGTVVRELPFGVTADDIAKVMRALLP
jgi:protein SCO1